MTSSSLPGRQGGLALILMVLIVAFVTVLTTGMYSQLNFNVKRTGNVINQEQAREYGIAVEALSRRMLTDNRKREIEKNAPNIDHNYEDWALKAVAIPLNIDITLEGQLDDLQGRFNINSLVSVIKGKSGVDPQAFDTFRRLLSALAVNPDLKAEKFVDWIDEDQEVFQFRGAEDETYLSKDPPYRTADNYFNDISEFWLIEGMTVEDFKKLSEHVSVLPPAVNSINVNTATKEVLESMSPNLSSKIAEQIVSERKDRGENDNTGYESKKEFLQLPALAGIKMNEKGFDVKSEYFQATLHATVYGRKTRLVSVIHRDKDGKTTVIRRDFGKKSKITKEVVVWK